MTLDALVIKPWKTDYQRNEYQAGFYKKSAENYEALTFDDVLIAPGSSQVKPGEVDVQSYFSRNVPLKIPVVSAAMDKVTGLRMLIWMAKLGGLGILHRHMSKEDQAQIVERAKYALNVLIEKPITFRPQTTVGEILEAKRKHNYEFNSFPIVNDENKLVGLVTGHHMYFVSREPGRRVESFMTPVSSLVTGPKDMDHEAAYEFMMKNMLKKLPLVDSDGVLSGLYDMDNLEEVITHKDTLNLDSRGQLMVGAAVGVYDYERADILVRKNVNVLVVDSAHGGHKDVVATVRELKRLYPNTDCVGGNISAIQAARDLIAAGADGLKVGQGPGSICDTRIVAGAGMPQITAIMNAVEGTQGAVPINADGGIRYSGDIPKAIAAGAQSVMLGSQLAGTDESPGEPVLHKGRRYKKIRGMGSESAMREREEAKERYGQGGEAKFVPEGVEGIVPYKGKLADALHQFVGGLRAGMGYAGAASIKDLNRIAKLVKPTAAGVRESHPHDIIITEEAPNYQTPTEGG